MADKDEISEALAAMLAKPEVKPPKVLNPQPPRPRWEATEENARADAVELVRVIREHELSDDEAADLVAATLLAVTGKLTPQQYEDRATGTIKSALQRARLVDDDLVERLQESHRRRTAKEDG